MHVEDDPRRYGRGAFLGVVATGLSSLFWAKPAWNALAGVARPLENSLPPALFPNGWRIYTDGPGQLAAAEASRDAFQRELVGAGYGEITTEIAPAGEFFYAEDYHQQYLQKNPNGYCGLGGTGVSCPIGTGVSN